MTDPKSKTMADEIYKQKIRCAKPGCRKMWVFGANRADKKYCSAACRQASPSAKQKKREYARARYAEEKAARERKKKRKR